MDIENNSVVTDVDTEILDGEITQISNDFSETYYFDGEQEEELEMLVAKAMKLGELYERKKWQAAKAQAIPDGFVVVPKEPTPKMIDAADNCAIDGKVTANIIYKAMLEAQEPAND
ncbi:hypothetical protein [Acinetobacter sp. YH12136]|uniref:hypothetical protein n=1 Tax=Acinetobacter sp. YH12136 TaxID=2601120 RepID=UPI0015D15F6B|nr:hypothetical protein [Acinetobacter sp. YH12136]